MSGRYLRLEGKKFYKLHFILLKNQLSNEWNWLRSLWHLLSNGQHENRECQQHCHSQSNLLSGVWRQTKDQHSQRRHHHAGKNDIIPKRRIHIQNDGKTLFVVMIPCLHVIQRFTSYPERDGNLWKWFDATSVISLCSDDDRRRLQFPLTVWHVIRGVDELSPIHHVYLKKTNTKRT